jgi:DNA-binding ferritin-like protein
MNNSTINIIKISNTDNTKIFAFILNRFLSSVKMMHWYTCNYNMHKIFGNLYDDLGDLFDSLQEEIIGTSNKNENYDRFPTLDIECIKDEEHLNYQDDVSILNHYMSNQNTLKDILDCFEFKSYAENSRSGLMNIKDEIVSRLNKTNYLLNMIKI